MHTYIKRVTFKPLSGGRYRCNQTGRVLTQKEILSHVSSILAGGKDVAVGVSPIQKGTASPKRSKGEKHASKYRAKHR